MTVLVLLAAGTVLWMVFIGLVDDGQVKGAGSFLNAQLRLAWRAACGASFATMCWRLLEAYCTLTSAPLF